ncbi:MAG: CotH kinase family protein [Fidelibacterota bacterium]
MVKRFSGFLVFLFCAVMLTAPAHIYSKSLCINEIMAANSQTLQDWEGDFPDWVELYNGDSVSINIKDFGLSDKADDPFRWLFPNITMEPEEYLLVFASDKDRKKIARHWETVIDQGDDWKYQYGSDAIPANWYTTNFDDSLWMQGKSGFGYGDGDDSTIVDPTLSLFARKTVTIHDLSNISQIILSVDYDDGFVAYLNGAEIARANIGVAGTPVSWDEPAKGQHEAQIINGGDPDHYFIDQVEDHLLQGENILAIQVHNHTETSSDLTLIPFLTLGMVDVPENAGGLSDILDFAPQHLHTNFKIKSDGEELLLSDAKGNLIDQVGEKKIPEDISWGRQPDGSNSWYLFESPTPGEPNIGEGVRELAKKPEFNYAPGFYTGPITIELSTETDGADIYYTLDGSEPTDSSALYRDPVSLMETTVLKAKTIDPNAISSKRVTHTYFIDEHSTLPVISLSTEPANLWDDETGIYVEGTNGITGYCSDTPKNWNQDWERPATIEFFESDKEPAFNIDCSIKIGGACTRLYPQKTLAVYTRDEYGAKKIDYAIFPDKPMEEYNNINIRNGGQDWWRALLRDGMMQTIVSDRMDIDRQAYRPVILYINGRYWGIHGLREKHNEHYIAGNHNIEDEDAIDILSGNMNIKEGTDTHYRNMMDFIKSHDMALDNNYNYIKTQMDIDEYINYQIAEIYFANIDWPGGNIKYWRQQKEGSKWRWIFFDLDLGFGAHPRGQYDSNSLANATAESKTYYANPAWSTLLFRSLLENDEFRRQFAQRYAIHIMTTFEPERVLNIADSLAGLIAGELPRHLQKWPQSTNLGHNWEEHMDIIREFALLRPGQARLHLNKKFDMSSARIVIETDLEKGTIAAENIEMIRPLTSIRLFKNIPTAFAAIPRSGYEFSHWEGISGSHADSINLSFTDNDTVRAIFTQSIGLDEEEETPKRFRLYDNYPNPFNPLTTIAYHLTSREPVTLEIFDTNGKKIETLVNRTQNAGYHRLQWQAGHYSSGIYFYRLEVDGTVLIGKCLLLK